MLHKLSAATVTRIKAQQVITGLVAAVKELLENALDAGATQIQVKLEGDGLYMIQVKDNGTGIPAEASDECASGYCTSKIVDFESLSHLTSYGFRGEALHSLCAEGEVEITTRTATDPEERTIYYNSDGSVKTDSNPNPPAIKQTVLLGKTGTSITVKNIFARTPVRLERMKKDRVKECKNILNLMYAYMLAHPRTSFSLSIKGHIEVSKLRTKKGVHNTTYEVIQELYGPMLANGLVQIETVNEDKSIKITGLLPKTDAEYKIVTRATNDRMFVYVNNRPVDFPAVTKIVNLFVRKWFAVVKRYPFAVLNIELKPDTYDVNVTPDKKKLFFHNENNLVQFIHNVLKSLYPVNDLDTIFAINPATLAANNDNDNDDDKDKDKEKDKDEDKDKGKGKGKDKDGEKGKGQDKDDEDNDFVDDKPSKSSNNSDDGTQSSLLPAEYHRTAPLAPPSPPSASSPPPTFATPSTPSSPPPSPSPAPTNATPPATHATPTPSAKPTSPSSSPPSSSPPLSSSPSSSSTSTSKPSLSSASSPPSSTKTPSSSTTTSSTSKPSLSLSSKSSSSSSSSSLPSSQPTQKRKSDSTQSSQTQSAQQAPAKKQKAQQHAYDITAFLDIVAITECAPSIDSTEAFSQDPKTKFSFYKDPMTNSQQGHTHFWDPEENLAVHPPRLCGQTTSNDKALFCVEYARRLFVFNPFKAQELLCYESMLRETVVPREPVDPPVTMTKDLFEGNEDMWRVVRAKSPTIIRVFHLNGFELHPRFDTRTKQDTVELRAVPKNIEGIGADDLVELVRELAKVVDKDDLSIPSSVAPIRPERVANYFINEANRITRDDMSELTTTQAQVLLHKLVTHHSEVHTKIQDSNLICCECPHGKQIFQFISSIPNVE